MGKLVAETFKNGKFINKLDLTDKLRPKPNLEVSDANSGKEDKPKTRKTKRSYKKSSS